MIQAKRLSLDDLRKLIAQARALAEFRPPRNRGAAPEQQQQIIDLLGLQPPKNNLQPVKKKSQPAKKRRKKT